MKDSSHRGFDPSTVKGPLQFFSLVAYVVALAILYAGLRVLSTGPQSLAWLLIIGALLLILGITVAIFMTMRRYHWTFFHPSEITQEYASAIQSLSGTGKLPPEDIDQSIREFFLDLAKNTQRYTYNFLMEIFDHLADTNQSPSVEHLNLTGKWSGIVNGVGEIIEIEQHGSIVFLKITVLNDDGTDAYTFKGEGRINSNIFVFSWREEHTSGMNVMSISPKGDVLEGKYFNQFGASGYERYKRVDEKQSEPS